MFLERENKRGGKPKFVNAVVSIHASLWRYVPEKNENCPDYR